MSNEESTIPSSPIKLKKTVSKVRRPRYQTPAPGAYYPERVRLDHNPSALILGKLERSGIYEETHNKKFIPGPGNYQDSGSQVLKLKKNLGTIVFTNTSKASQEKLFMEHKRDHNAGIDSPGPGCYEPVPTHRIHKGRGKQSTISPSFSFTEGGSDRVELVPGMKDTPGPGTYDLQTNRPSTAGGRSLSRSNSLFGTSSRFSEMKAVATGDGDVKYVYVNEKGSDDEEEEERGGEGATQTSRRQSTTSRSFSSSSSSSSSRRPKSASYTKQKSAMERQVESSKMSSPSFSFGQRNHREILQMNERQGILIRVPASSTSLTPGAGSYDLPSSLFNTMESTRKNTPKVRFANSKSVSSLTSQSSAPDAMYDIKSTLEPSMNSQYRNNFGVKFNESKSKRFIEGVMEEKAKEDIPGPGSYRNVDGIRSSSSIRITSANRDQAEKLYMPKSDTGFDANQIYAGRDSPGPGSYNPKKQGHGYSVTFGNNKKTTSRVDNNNTNVGPGSYHNPESSYNRNRKAYSWGKGSRDQAGNIISPDYRPSVSKTFIENPGPGTYYQDPIEQMKRNKRGRGVRFGGGPRFEQMKRHELERPGPGQYNLGSSVRSSAFNQKGHRFGTSERLPLDHGLVG
jgi:hypothetical protein